MKINVSDLPAIVSAWADRVLIPKSSPVQIMMIVFAIGQFKDRLIALARYAADKDGKIDLDELQTNANVALEKAGGRILVPVLNYSFDKDDLVSLFEAAKGFAK